jgi:hypothetical protein
MQVALKNHRKIVGNDQYIRKYLKLIVTLKRFLNKSIYRNKNTKCREWDENVN